MTLDHYQSAGGVTLARLQTIRDQLAPKATDLELEYFSAVCNRLDLSPFADQIVLIGRWDSRAGRDVHRHQITVAGRRALAARTGLLEGIDGPVWCGPRVDGGPLDWREVWDDDEPPYCARVLVYRRNWKVPANGTAKWSEFRQTGKEKNLTGLWAKMPAHMLGKCAESLALRRAFPDTITADTVDGFDELPDTESEQVAAEASAPLRFGESANAQLDRRVNAADQALAHRLVAALPAEDLQRWLARWNITDFGAPWPAEAVAAAMNDGT